MLRLVILWLCWAVACGYIEHTGPRFPATKGEVWPAPQQQKKSELFRIVNPAYFKFDVVGFTCDILENATKRYDLDIKTVIAKRNTRLSAYLSKLERNEIKKKRLADKNYIGRLERLLVNLASPCEKLPSLNMDEAYTLKVLPNGINGSAILTSASIWGILRGLETFYQGMYFMADNTTHLQINSTNISDFPRFSHRGILLDTSRHFITKKKILNILDGMSYNKLNVFHWHIVDDMSFPYESVKFPKLSENGAYSPSLVYKQQDVADIIEYARMRGIRVIPEFDTPGHTRSWGAAFPNLLTQCYDYKGNLLEGKLGPMDPSSNDVYKFMGDFLAEVSTVFPENYTHLGGDEVSFECWQNNPKIAKFMKEQNIDAYKKLEIFYGQKIVEIVDKLGLAAIVWQEVFDRGVKISNKTVVHIWYGNMASILHKVTMAGHKALLSSCWYLDHLNSGGDWSAFYECDPHDFDGTEAQKKLVIGGEACMWSEYVDDANVISRIFPRASAAAEKLWSSQTQYQKAPSYEVQCRMEEHVCRMNHRGIAAQPASGPGYCF